MFPIATDIPSYVSWLLPVLVIGIVVTFFWQGFITWLLYGMSKQDRSVEAMEKRLHEQAAAAVKDRHDLTTKLVDERFRAMTHEVQNHMQGLLSTIDLMKSRLEDGDDHFEGLDDKARNIELGSVAKLDALKDYMREHLASKRDLESHQQTMASELKHVNGTLSVLGQDVAVLKAQGAKRGGQ